MLRPLVEYFLNGKSGMLAAMGPSGLGKTHTVFGCAKELGMVVDSIKHCFVIGKYFGEFWKGLLENYVKTEEAKVEELIKAVAESGAKVIVSGAAVGEMALHFCELYNSHMQLQACLKEIHTKMPHKHLERLEKPFEGEDIMMEQSSRLDEEDSDQDANNIDSDEDANGIHNSDMLVIGECHSTQISDKLAARYRMLRDSKDSEIFLEFCLHTILYQPSPQRLERV
ncbi:T-complex protein 1 subunit theta-like [Forsythia ovata]|uniref:T-complex protein 1 subunit theta-like n=1 Tax=Forsythia ovata TaxID=205694 RepID=A0ABD1TM61_9LAMI